MVDDKRSIGLVNKKNGRPTLPEASLACQEPSLPKFRLAKVVLGISKPFLANVALLPEASLACQEPSLPKFRLANVVLGISKPFLANVALLPEASLATVGDS